MKKPFFAICLLLVAVGFFSCEEPYVGTTTYKLCVVNQLQDSVQLGTSNRKMHPLQWEDMAPGDTISGFVSIPNSEDKNIVCVGEKMQLRLVNGSCYELGYKDCPQGPSCFRNYKEGEDGDYYFIIDEAFLSTLELVQ